MEVRPRGWPPVAVDFDFPRPQFWGFSKIEIHGGRRDAKTMVARRHLQGRAVLRFWGLDFRVLVRGLVHYGAADIRRPGLYERFSTENRIKKRIVNS